MAVFEITEMPVHCLVVHRHSNIQKTVCCITIQRLVSLFDRYVHAQNHGKLLYMG